MPVDINCSSDCSKKDEFGNCSIPGSDLLPLQCVGPWAEHKYYFLERYIIATRYARKKYTDKGNSVYIDLFSGPGKCVIRDQKKEINNGGFRVVSFKDIPFNHHFFCDINPINIDAMRKRCATYNKCYFECGDSNQKVVELVHNLKTKDYRYHFVYLDPFGPDNLKFSTINQLASLRRVDLLIHFPIGAIRRNISKWMSSEQTTLDEFLGTTAWRVRIKNMRGGRLFSCLLDIYMEQLLSAGFPEDGLKYELSNGGPPSMALIKNTTEVELYALVLASKHPIAQKIWNSVTKISPTGEARLF